MNQETVDEFEKLTVERAQTERKKEVDAAKAHLAHLWADGNERLEGALVSAFDTIELESTPKPTMKRFTPPPGWPEIQLREKVVFKDFWCTVIGFTARGVELAIGDPTAQLIKRVQKNAAKEKTRKTKGVGKRTRPKNAKRVKRRKK